MLLDNERIVDHFKLVTEMNYLMEKSQEAYQLLAQNANLGNQSSNAGMA